MWSLGRKWGGALILGCGGEEGQAALNRGGGFLKKRHQIIKLLVDYSTLIIERSRQQSIIKI